MSDQKNLLYNNCVQSMSYFTCVLYDIIAVMRKTICHKEEFMYHDICLYYCIKYPNTV